MDSTDLEIAKRLANIETLLVELLSRRKAATRKGTKRSSSLRERLRREALANPNRPSERHYDAAKRLITKR
jgi:hypothetical protein